MNPKIKNTVLFIVILVVLSLIYFFFFGRKTEEPTLVSAVPGAPATVSGSPTPLPAAGEFLPVLLNIQSIKLDDSIFSDPAFLSLRDSSIELIPDGNEGRPNPFAPIGSDVDTAPLAPETQPVPATETPAEETIAPAEQ